MTSIPSIVSTRKPKGFYVYAYLRPDGSPFYIGKGTKGRAWAPHDHGRVRVPDPSQIVILCEGLTDEQSKDQEKAWVAHFGTRYDRTGILHNMTKGGDGLDPQWCRAVKSGEWQWKRLYADLHAHCLALGIRLPEGRQMVRDPMLQRPYGRAKVYAQPAHFHWESLGPDPEQPNLPLLRLEVFKAFYSARAEGLCIKMPPGCQLRFASWSAAECHQLLEALAV